VKVTKSQIRKIIQEEIAKVREGSPAMAGDPRIDRLFEKGALGYQLADKYSNSLMIDEDSDFLAVIDAIKDGLRNWREFRVDYADRKAAGVYENMEGNSPLVMGMEKDYAMALSTVLGISPEEVDSMTPQQIGELGTSIRNHYRNKLNKRPPPMADPRRAGKYTPREG